MFDTVNMADWLHSEKQVGVTAPYDYSVAAKAAFYRDCRP